MELQHELGGDFVMTLSDADIAALHTAGNKEFPLGPAGPYNRTIISYGAGSEQRAYVGEETNLTVIIPRNDDPEVVIEHADIKAEAPATRQDVEHYFGEAGRIILRAAHGNKYGRWYS